MASILIQSNSEKHLNLLLELAKQLGDKSIVLSKEDAEDIALGALMNKVKTGGQVSRNEIMRKLKSK